MPALSVSPKFLSHHLRDFALENMLLTAIWQGKNKPPLLEYMQAFGDEVCRLHDQGFTINPPGSELPVVVRIALLLAMMDLQAKSYVLNMTTRVYTMVNLAVPCVWKVAGMLLKGNVMPGTIHKIHHTRGKLCRILMT